MKSILSLLFWAAIVIYYLAALNFAHEKRHEQVCVSVEITVLDSARSRFVTAEDIRRTVNTRNMEMTGMRFDSIDVHNIEKHLNGISSIQQTDIYKIVNGTVHIDITQREPVIRIINRYGESLYIDAKGNLLQHSSHYAAHVLVANGYISLRSGQKDYNVFTAETEPGRRNIMRELFELTNYINGSRFWKAQIQQIYVNEDGDFELIPLVGAHVIIFGTFDNPDEKFAKLESFYRNGLNVKGWNTYEKINLKYDKQIVASKR